jgi:hypothetical protein
MVILVIVVDVAAMTLYSFTHLRDAGSDVKLGFTIGWTVLTLAIVLTGLRRIRLARDTARHGPGRRGS